ncbi:MAG: hypothetical protein UY05_C0009G0016 [Candidatus Peregrinibacteria bacterium GW2011_GWA2_47_7]|nr:MAG: hypothetical protein UY05_C0009G0016 [Candidatus Peregrinibacteria bacterium GW2011_GWA2_47_7]
MDVMDILLFTEVFIGGLFGAFIGSISGGGGLIILPILLFAGLPVDVALATCRFAGIGLGIGGASQYAKAKQIIWLYVAPLAVIGVIGAYIGTQILIKFDKQLLTDSVGYLILFSLPLTIMKKDFGLYRRERSTFLKIIGFIIFFFLSIWSGFFGAGSAPIFFYTYMAFFGFSIIQAAATNKIPLTIGALFTLGVFIAHDMVRFDIGAVLFVSTLIGSSLGARMAISKGAAWAKAVFIVVVCVSAVKLILFS